MSLDPVPQPGPALSSCTNDVLVPFAKTPDPQPRRARQHRPAVLRQANRGFVGLVGREPPLRRQPVLLPRQRRARSAPSVRPAPPPDGGTQPPAAPSRRAVRDAGAAEPNAPGGPLVAVSASAPVGQSSLDFKPRPFNARRLEEAAELLKEVRRDASVAKRGRALPAQELAAAREAGRRRPSEARDPQAPRRLPRDPRAVRAGARASAATS